MLMSQKLKKNLVGNTTEHAHTRLFNSRMLDYDRLLTRISSTLGISVPTPILLHSSALTQVFASIHIPEHLIKSGMGLDVDRLGVE
jgi:hypothetical protein